MITFDTVGTCVNYALNNKPPKELEDYCGLYYSPYYLLMHALCSFLAPCNVVELGCEKGRGVLSMALNKNVMVYGVESQPNIEILDMLCNTTNFILFKHTSNLLPELIRCKPISLIHFDTEHSYAQVKSEFSVWKDVLVPGAILLYDDIHARNDDVIKWIVEQKFDNLILEDRLHPSCGYAVVQI